MKINAMFLKVSTGWRRFKTAVSEKLTTYDPAEDLTSEEAIETFMAEALKTKDAGFIAYADSVVARARTKDTPADGILAHTEDRMKAVSSKLRVEGLYGRRLRPHLGQITSVTVALVAGVVAGSGGTYLYLKNTNTLTHHDGVAIQGIQGLPVTLTGSMHINVGISFEQYKAALKRRELKVTEQLRQAHAEESRILEIEKAEIERRLADTQAGYKELQERIAQLETIRDQVPAAFLDRARATLVQGDRREADWLFAQLKEQYIQAGE